MNDCEKKNCPPPPDFDFVAPLVERICSTYADQKGVNHSEGFNLPREKEVLKILDEILEMIFPGFGGRESYSHGALRFAVSELVAQCYTKLRDMIRRSFRYSCGLRHKDDCDCPTRADMAARKLLEAIPELRETMKLDLQAAFDGDPAARSLDEVVISYPGVKAIIIQRVAHLLYHEEVPLIPRMMTEYAHRMTGIDIHPGAHLDRGVFIDHGTGVVIGETCEIGDGVKIYQGVTLGALSFPKDACGKIIKGAKRHPSIRRNVTIYAGATILGPVEIGEGSVIGGNVWLTESVAPGTRISIAPPELTIRNANTPKPAPKTN